MEERVYLRQCLFKLSQICKIKATMFSPILGGKQAEMACPILLANMACPTWTPTPRMHLGKEDEIITFLRPGGAPVTELATLMQVNNGQILLCGCKCPDSNTKQRVQCVLNLAKDCLVECSQAAREFCIEDFSSCYA